MKKLLLMIFILCYSITAYAAENNDKNIVVKEYIESNFISVAAASCLGIYLPEKSTEFNYLKDHGWDIVSYKEKDNSVETNFAIAHSYFKDIDKDIYLVTVRGSASKEDWKINFQTSKMSYNSEIPLVKTCNDVKDSACVHEGFIKYTDTILLNSVLDKNRQLKGLFKEVKENDKSYMILTGHSLGGAVATLLGTRLADLGVPKEKFTVITFGAPAVGNKKFAEEYGDKIRLIRITNTADPVPGSLQTFFGGYKQFGEHHKYYLSTKISNFQHSMAMYFDHSVSQYIKKFDKAVEFGIVKPLPAYKFTKNVPVVALWIKSSPEIDKLDYVPDVKRVLINEYQMMLPSYIVMDKPRDLEKIYSYSEILELSKAAGADYVLLFGIDGNKPSNKNYLYLTLTQVLSKTDGTLLNMNTFAKKVDPSAGVITAAGDNIYLAKNELLKNLPFLRTNYTAEIYGL